MTRSTALLALAMLLLAPGCGGASSEERREQSHQAGVDYGTQLVGSGPARMDEAQLRAACADSIEASRVRDQRTGEYGEPTDFVDAAFIDGCREAATAD
jgi:hypothetical protein